MYMKAVTVSSDIKIVCFSKIDFECNLSNKNCDNLLGIYPLQKTENLAPNVPRRLLSADWPRFRYGFSNPFLDIFAPAAAPASTYEL